MYFSTRFARLASLLVLCGVTLCSLNLALAAGPTGDPFKDNSLTKTGNVYVLPDEAPVLDGMKALRATKLEADKEVRARTALENSITTKRKIVKDAEKEWEGLEARLPAITKPDIHNRMVVRMNRLFSDRKQALVAIKDLEEQAAKLSTTNKIKFVDSLVALNAKADAVVAKYTKVAADPAVKAAVTKLNITANPKIVVGPSPDLAAAIDDIKKWQGAVESEAIPLREQHGIFMTEVLINGEPVMMGVDTGASTVTLPFEVAQKLKVTPTEQDPTIQLKLANGALIEGKEITLNSVRVGRFTVEGVKCVVLEKGLPEAPSLLGQSFLNHFIVRLDPSKNELNLTDLKNGAGKPASAPAKSEK